MVDNFILGLNQEIIKHICERRLLENCWRKTASSIYEDEAAQERLLAAQLSLKDDRGSRCSRKVELQAKWIHTTLLYKKSSQILDLGCGPGHYSHQLAKMGHKCYGIDISKLAIDYAKWKSDSLNLNCIFYDGNILSCQFPDKNDIIIMPYSNFNTFTRAAAKKFIKKINVSLKPKGLFYLEALNYIKPESKYTNTWHTAAKGNFLCSDKHVCLQERYWHAKVNAIIDRFFIINLSSNTVSTYTNKLYLYSEAEYKDMLRKCGFDVVQFFTTPPAITEDTGSTYISILAKRNKRLFK